LQLERIRPGTVLVTTA